MDERIRVTIEVDRAEHDALAGIASEGERTVGDVAAEAIRARIDLERDWEEAVRAGQADIAAGRTISHEEYVARAAERRRCWLAERAA